MYKLNSNFICVEKHNKDIILYDRKTHIKYLINSSLNEILRKSIKGINIKNIQNFIQNSIYLEKIISLLNHTWILNPQYSEYKLIQNH